MEYFLNTTVESISKASHVKTIHYVIKQTAELESSLEDGTSTQMCYICTDSL